MATVTQLDLSVMTVRELNQHLHHGLADQPSGQIEITNPDGLHSIAAGMDQEVDIEIRGHAGYFAAGMNQRANVTIHGNVGWSVAENIMSGCVRVQGHASECAAASGHGGLVVIEGDDGIILLDTLWKVELAEKVRAAFAQQTDKPIVAIIYSHGHLDHVV